MIFIKKTKLLQWFFLIVASANFLFIPSKSYAGWQLVGETTTARYFTDMTTIKPAGFKRSVMMYQNLRYKRGTDGAVSIKARIEYDCRYKMHKMLTAKSYPGPNLIGKKLKSKNPGQSWNPTFKISRFMFTAVCAIPSDGKLAIKNY